MGNLFTRMPGDCNFCIVHKYGVYVLGVSAILVILVTLYIYWKDFMDICSGRAKAVPFQGFDEAGPAGQENFLNTVDRMNPMLQPLKSQGQMQPQPQSQNQTVSQPPIQVQTPPQPPIQLQLPSIERKKRKLSPDPQHLTVDTFKLPTPDDQVGAHESTGSNYFKQMMRGKRPVASISQYALMKKGKKKVKEHKGHDKNQAKKHHPKKTKS